MINLCWFLAGFLGIFLGHSFVVVIIVAVVVVFCLFGLFFVGFGCFCLFV